MSTKPSSRRLLGSRQFVEAGGYRELDFSNVSMRTFPLRANIAQLQRFCDAYLNIAPPEIAHFRPVAPFVLFQVLNYGRMSPVAKNVGWVAQHEVLFGVPVVGHWHYEGERVEGLATVSPFIFVDNDWSVQLGREIYGWPKFPAQVVPEVNAWLRDPRLARRLLNLKTKVFPRLYAGMPQLNLPIVEVLQSPTGLGQWPPDFNYLMGPLTQLPQAFFDGLAALPDVMRSLLGFWAPQSQGDLGGTFMGQLEQLLSIPPEALVNTLNVKQFRSSRAGVAAYQSLVNGVMETRATLASGLLGSVDQLRGDPSGGLSLLIHRYPDFPIIESLGLHVQNQWSAGGHAVAELKPFLPFWTIVDLRYNMGQRLCWRSLQTDWSTGDEPADDSSRRVAVFNTALGPVLEAVQGPFEFFDTTIRVLPLKASERRLTLADNSGADALAPGDLPDLGHTVGRQFKEALIAALQQGGLPSDPAQLDIQLTFLPVVLLLVEKLGSMSAEANDIGFWGGRTVSFARILNVKLISVEDQVPAVDTNFLVIPFAFAQDPIAVSASREVLGLPTEFAQIQAEADPWVESSTRDFDHPLIRVCVRDYPALGVGQEATVRTLFHIDRVAPTPGLAPVSLKPYRVFHEQALDPARPGTVLSYLTLKQFRDEEDPTLVCYRELAVQDRVIGKWEGVQSGKRAEVDQLPGEYEVRFQRLPSWPLVETLGLEVEWEVDERGVETAVCKVEDPHWVKADLRWNLPVNLRWQSVDGVWRHGYRQQGDEYGPASVYLLDFISRARAATLRSGFLPLERPQGFVERFNDSVDELARDDALASATQNLFPPSMRDPKLVTLDDLVRGFPATIEAPTAFSMPSRADLYPAPPLQFDDVETIVAGFEVAPEPLEKWIPAPLEPVAGPSRPGRLFLVYNRYPDGSPFGAFQEVAIVTPVRARGTRLVFCLYSLVDNDEALSAGRECWGFPRKLGEIHFSEERGILVARRAGWVLASAELGKSEPTSPTALERWNLDQVNLQVLPGVAGQPPAVQRLTIVKAEDVRIREALVGDGVVGALGRADAGPDQRKGPHPLAELTKSRTEAGRKGRYHRFRCSFRLPPGDVLFDYLTGWEAPLGPG
ncbi:MAG: acetoacetate decarboxylase family protein [Thermoanaerobaculia bacterium]|nr:acetoacetate decarboxylase family protein [Thermoanaerobaculia bacterium]